MATKIDQKAYLQKYLGGHSSDKKKKKKKKSFRGKGLKIVVDDIDVSKLRPLEGDELDILAEGEDAPQIAGIIDERPEEVKKLEQFKTSSKWRVISQDDGFNSKLQIEEIKKDVVEQQKENELIFGKMYSDSEDDDRKNDSDRSSPRQQTVSNQPDSDQSPLRKKDSNQHNSSRKPQNNSDSDFSPPRRKEKGLTKSRTELKSKEKNYDSDLSPPRKHVSQLNKSKERVRKPSRWGDGKVKEKSRSTSPTRLYKSQQGDSDVSPPRKQKKNYDSDLSPPRKKKHNDSDASPARKSQKHDKRRSPGNFSQKRNHDSSSQRAYKSNKSSRNRSSDSDLSPPRKRSSNKRQNSSSPPRKSRKHSPERSNRRRGSDSDPSPPRKPANRTDKYQRNDDSPPPSNKKMAARTLDGKMAGLSDARQLRNENEASRRREEEAFKSMTDEVSGRNAQVVSRKGKRENSEERRKLEEKAKRQEELNEKYKRWGKGLKQLQEQESRVQEYLHESAKPLARHRDDRDLESTLKQVERAGDPMLQYIKDKKRERGELPPEKPRYKGSFPPNRFNIPPGYRWDGVDRSNGYEKKYFDQQSKRRAQEEEAYKWSTEDL